MAGETNFETWKVARGGADARLFQYMAADDTERDVFALSGTFTVYSDLGVTALFTKSATAGTKNSQKAITLAVTDTAQPAGEYYATMVLSDGTKRIGTLVIVGY